MGIFLEMFNVRESARVVYLIRARTQPNQSTPQTRTLNEAQTKHTRAPVGSERAQAHGGKFTFTKRCSHGQKHTQHTQEFDNKCVSSDRDGPSGVTMAPDAKRGTHLSGTQFVLAAPLDKRRYHCDGILMCLKCATYPK